MASNPDPPGRIVVVDDDPTVADVVGRYLVRDGHTVECVHDGYEATLASLSQADTSSSNRLGFREFIMRDVDGRVQKVRVDVSYVEGLLEHLDTTPAAAQAPMAIPQLSDLEG